MSRGVVTKEAVEVAFAGNPQARITMDVVEVATPFITRSPTTITGGGVTKYAVEAIVADSGGLARVTQYVAEGLFLDTSNIADSGVGGAQTHTSGSVT